MIKYISIAVAVAAASVLAAGFSASATAPGANGQIVFRRYVPTKQPTSALFVVNPDGTGERQLTHPTKGVTDNHPSWSPDASKIAFERCQKDHCEVWTVRADGAGLRRLGATCHRTPPTPKCDERGAPAWSPHGQAIVMNRAYGPINPAIGIKYSGLALTAGGGHVR